MSMTYALPYLTACSMRNRLRSRFRRLRQPRYLIGALAGILYFYFAVFRHAGLYSRWAGGQALFVGSVAVFLLTALNWVSAASKHGLVFTQAEVHFLFQAPLTRRQLVHYKLFGGQIASVLSSLFLTLMFRRTAAAPMFFAGTWLLLTTVNVHSTGVALASQSLVQHGRSGFMRQRLPLLVLAAAFTAIATAIVLAWPNLVAATGPRGVIDQLQRLTASGVGGVVFWPFRAVVALPLSRSAPAFLHALPGVLVLLVLNYIWVLRADTAFEEAAAKQAEKLADLRRSGPFRPTVRKTAATPFALAARGRPELAIVWKNLIQLGRYATLPKLIGSTIVIVMVAGIFVFTMHGESTVDLVSMLTYMALAMTVFFGPQSVKNDLRRDLSNLAVLKTWPMGGAAVVRGEVLAPACMLTAIAWLLIVAGAILSAGTSAAVGVDRWSVEVDQFTYAVAAMVLVPGVILIQLILQNAFVLLFPAWAVPPTSPAAAMQGMGQRYLLMFGSVIALLVALLPVAIIAGAVGFGIYYATHAIPILVPAVVGSVVLAAECWLATELLGGRFDRMDVSALEPAD